MKTQKQIEKAAVTIGILLRKYGSQCEQLPDDKADRAPHWIITPEPPNESNWYKMSYRIMSYLLSPPEEGELLSFFREGGIPSLDEVLQIARLSNPKLAKYLDTEEGYSMFKNNYDFHRDNWEEYWTV
jgi:hypothetical protein